LIYSLESGSEIPPHLSRVLKRFLLGNAACLMCSGTSGELHTRQIQLHLSSSRLKQPHYVVCECGNPVWRLDFEGINALDQALDTAERAAQRKMSLSLAGGRHSPKEIQQILALQENRCIYCNVLFAGPVRPTKDHLLPVSHGGSDWALSVVIACRNCNSRRGEIPFRTYCKLLSPAQNRRILRFLANRIESAQRDQLPWEVFESLVLALGSQNSRHYRYLSMLRRSPACRRYASLNQLLPRSPVLLLRKWRVVSSKHASR